MSEPRQAERAAVAALIRDGSRSFHAASLLLPRRMRAPAYALYAFCREVDDAVDLHADKPTAVEEARARLARIYAGQGLDGAVDRCFAETVEAFDLPRALPEALIEGMAWDAEGRTYATLSELRAYAARVAGVVGAMMTVLFGVRDGATLARACDLGVAMQLTNIARDVGEDARAGRLYLPREMLAAEGVEVDALLARPAHSAALGRVVAALLAEAERLYDRSAAGVAGLPGASRPCVRAARLLYREIGREVARRGFDGVSERAVVGSSRKRRLALEALIPFAPDAAALRAPTLGECAFLVDAAARAPAATPPRVKDAGEAIARLAELALIAHRRRERAAPALARR